MDTATIEVDAMNSPRLTREARDKQSVDSVTSSEHKCFPYPVASNRGDEPETYLECKKHHAIANFMRFKQVLGETAAEDKISRAWSYVKALPTYGPWTSPSECTNGRVVHDNIFAVQGLVRVSPQTTRTNLMDGLEAYIGNELFVPFATLHKGRVGRVLLCQLFEIGQWDGELVGLVSLESHLLFLEKPCAQDFVMDRQIKLGPTQGQGDGDNSKLWEIRHLLSDAKWRVGISEMFSGPAAQAVWRENL
ncbi:hypothetical protein CBER1_11367 [Cercospora berteroae]|uniref:Uncharacterized protein n=1 Tax=Cercospora berteroae TaxID=357750 RepID=A0A2S6CLW3_9PEZI|nr:hypothetical protein CBER1_11367 [Cercospora berteroae]